MLETFNNTNIKNERNLNKNNHTNTLVNMGKEDNSKAVGKLRGPISDNNYNK